MSSMAQYNEAIKSICEEYNLTLIDFERIRLENLESTANNKNHPELSVNRAIGITLWKIFKELK